MNRQIKMIAIVVVIALVSIAFYQHRKKDQSGQPSPLVPPNQEQKKPAPVQSKIQIVFALDATGSMSGLIGAAKEKIWSIAGSLAQAEPSPVIEIGLVFYRDRGDAFVTKQVALSTDLDHIYKDLMQISADGGGDAPESVNQALNEAITKFSWDSASKVYKAVFLVGDCPPHMDYSNDIKYPQSCILAKQKDIMLNTILMGNDLRAKKIWHKIADCSQGSFTQVNMDANDIVVNSPYDSVIANLSDQLDDTRIYFGTDAEKSVSSEKISKSKYISGAAKVNIKAQRAEYNASKSGKMAYYGERELIEGYKNKSLDLKTIKDEELPEEMKKMTADQRQLFVEQKIHQRDSLNMELVKFTNLRQDFIEKDLKTRKAGEVENSFSNQIYKSIQSQTEKKGIHLKATAKY